MDNSCPVLRLDWSHSLQKYLFGYMNPSSIQRRRLAHGLKSSVNSKFFISAMLASESNGSFIQFLRSLFTHTGSSLTTGVTWSATVATERTTSPSLKTSTGRIGIWFFSGADDGVSCQVPPQQDWFPDSASRGLPHSQVSPSLARFSLNYWQESH